MFTRSSDAHYLALSSQDGFCSLVEFENDELGSPYSLSGKQPCFFCCHTVTTPRILISLLHIFLEGNVSNKDSKITVQIANVTGAVSTGNVSAVLKTESEEKADDMAIEASVNDGSVTTESGKTLTREKADDMIITSTGNIADFRKNEAEEKAVDMVIEATGNIEGVIADGRKNEPEEKTDNMVIETTGSIDAAKLDSRKAAPDDKAEKQLRDLGTVNFGAHDEAEKHPDGKQTEAKDKIEKLQSSLDGKQSSSSKSTPTSNKPAKKRITPVAIDP